MMVDTFAASNAENLTALSHLRRALSELDQAKRLLESGENDNVARELIEITRRAADLALINQDRMEERRQRQNRVVADQDRNQPPHVRRKTGES